MERTRTFIYRSTVITLVGFAMTTVCPVTAHATESSDNAGPLNVSATGESASRINESAFVAVAVDDVNPGAIFTATATSPAGTVTVPVYAIPVDGAANPITGADNATVWVPLTSGATTVRLTWSSGSPTTETYPVGSPSSGASLAVVQDADGSRSITATAIIPKFSGNNNAGQLETISDAFFLQSVSTGGFGNYAFHVFDADTREWIDPVRTGVQKRIVSVNGTDMLEMVDPLVLPESALGRNIRVGFVSYYYTDPYTTPTNIPIRYAGLSAAVLMRLGSSAASSATLAAMQQFAVPAGTQADACGSLAPEHVDTPALRQMRDEGWSVSYAQWPNEGNGGWVCSRQPVLTSLGWVVR